MPPPLSALVFVVFLALFLCTTTSVVNGARVTTNLLYLYDFTNGYANSGRTEVNTTTVTDGTSLNHMGTLSFTSPVTWAYTESPYYGLVFSGATSGAANRLVSSNNFTQTNSLYTAVYQAAVGSSTAFTFEFWISITDLAQPYSVIYKLGSLASKTVYSGSSCGSAMFPSVQVQQLMKSIFVYIGQYDSDTTKRQYTSCSMIDLSTGTYHFGVATESLADGSGNRVLSTVCYYRKQGEPSSMLSINYLFKDDTCAAKTAFSTSKNNFIPVDEPLSIGSVQTFDNGDVSAWKGILHLAAMYSRKLSLAEFDANYVAGLGLRRVVADSTTVMVEDNAKSTAKVLDIGSAGLVHYPTGYTITVTAFSVDASACVSVFDPNVQITSGALPYAVTGLQLKFVATAGTGTYLQCKDKTVTVTYVAKSTGSEDSLPATITVLLQDSSDPVCASDNTDSVVAFSPLVAKPLVSTNVDPNISIASVSLTTLPVAACAATVAQSMSFGTQGMQITTVPTALTSSAWRLVFTSTPDPLGFAGTALGPATLMTCTLSYKTTNSRSFSSNTCVRTVNVLNYLQANSVSANVLQNSNGTLIALSVTDLSDTNKALNATAVILTLPAKGTLYDALPASSSSSPAVLRAITVADLPYVVTSKKTVAFAPVAGEVSAKGVTYATFTYLFRNNNYNHTSAMSATASVYVLPVNHAPDYKMDVGEVRVPLSTDYALNMNFTDVDAYNAQAQTVYTLGVSCVCPFCMTLKCTQLELFLDEPGLSWAQSFTRVGTVVNGNFEVAANRTGMSQVMKYIRITTKASTSDYLEIYGSLVESDPTGYWHTSLPVIHKFKIMVASSRQSSYTGNSATSLLADNLLLICAIIGVPAVLLALAAYICCIRPRCRKSSDKAKRKAKKRRLRRKRKLAALKRKAAALEDEDRDGDGGSEDTVDNDDDSDSDSNSDSESDSEDDEDDDEGSEKDWVGWPLCIYCFCCPFFFFKWVIWCICCRKSELEEAAAKEEAKKKRQEERKQRKEEKKKRREERRQRKKEKKEGRPYTWYELLLCSPCFCVYYACSCVYAACTFTCTKLTDEENDIDEANADAEATGDTSDVYFGNNVGIAVMVSMGGNLASKEIMYTPPPEDAAARKEVKEKMEKARKQSYLAVGLEPPTALGRKSLQQKALEMEIARLAEEIETLEDPGALEMIEEEEEENGDRAENGKGLPPPPPPPLSEKRGETSASASASESSLSLSSSSSSGVELQQIRVASDAAIPPFKLGLIKRVLQLEQQLTAKREARKLKEQIAMLQSALVQVEQKAIKRRASVQKKSENSELTSMSMQRPPPASPPRSPLSEGGSGSVRLMAGDLHTSDADTAIMYEHTQTGASWSSSSLPASPV